MNKELGRNSRKIISEDSSIDAFFVKVNIKGKIDTIASDSLQKMK